MAALQVRLSPALKRDPAPAAIPVLDPAGPRVSIGGARGIDNLAIPVKPEAATLFGPRGACLLNGGNPRDGTTGPLCICDTGHHRVLGWNHAPGEDGVAADWVIGQKDFASEGRNGRGAPGAATLNVPTGICAVGAGLAVADAWNHRVLLWFSAPSADNVPADIVLGQRDFTCVEPNRGLGAASAQSLFWPYGVHWDGANFWVCDTGNRRVLMWRDLPQDPGRAADLVLGQAEFGRRDENGGGEANACSMRWPHALSIWDGKLCVTDAGNNRIQVWNRCPERHNAPCDSVLGQRDFHSVDHNQSRYWPDAATLHMPYGIAAAGRWCIAADTANSRLIAWRAGAAGGAPACALSGQAEFTAKGDNAWRTPTRRSLSWPYGVSTRAGMAVIADSGNNRVALWPLSSELAA
jgi:hypothetical protein